MTRVHITEDEQYPWLDVRPPAHWSGTEIEQDWVEVPEDVVERYERACDEWHAAMDALWDASAAATVRGGKSAAECLAERAAKS